jgi:molybdate transport system ATP-binding protein
MTKLAIDVGLRRDGFTLEARFESDAAVTALFGRSGAGKSTLLQIVAGLVVPDRGYVVVDDEVLVDIEGGGHIVPAHRRRVGYVFQDGRLFPHFDVRGNLRYAERFAPRASRSARFAEIVEMLGLAPLLDRRIHGLSGGERQRIAIGRALLASPRVLLLDEPLASLDHARREEVLAYVERLRDATRIPILYVSHEPVEVARLAGTVVLLEAGRVVAVGSPGDVLAAAGGEDDPASVLDAVVVSHDDHYALSAVSAGGAELHVPRISMPPGTSLRVVIRARDVMLSTQAPVGVSAQNVLVGEISTLRDVDARSVDVVVACGGTMLVARVTRRAVDALALVARMRVHALIKTVAIDRSTRPGAAD